MRTILGLDARPADAGPAPVSARRTVTGLNPAPRPVKSADAREQKLGATARSFAILEHVANSRAPVDVLDIIASLKLPKATAYRLVDWFVTQGYLVARTGAPAADRRPQAHQSRFRRAVGLDAQRHAARRAAAPGAYAQRDLQYRHPAQWRGGLSRPRGSRALAAAAALHHRLARAVALQRHRQAVPGAGAVARAAAACCKAWNCAASPNAPSPTERGSTPNCGKSARSKCRSTARNISSA